MTAGSPFGFGFGFGPVPMPGPVDSDPGPMQLDDEQRRNIVARLLGAQMFHPGSGPAVMGALGDQGQDQDPGQSGGQSASVQPPSGPAFDSPLARAMSLPNASPNDAAAYARRAPYDPSDAPQMLRTASPTPPGGSPGGDPGQGGPQLPAGSALASALGGMPSMTTGQMSPPQMPAPPQEGPQQDASAPSPGIPSMIGAAFPQMSVLGGPQATGAIPQAGPRAAPQAPAPASSEDDEAAPQVAQGAPAARAVPMPPVRPSELSSLADAARLPANSFDPLTGQPVSGSPRPLRGDFDPLTGQPVSGSPQPLASRADSSGAPARQGPEPTVGSPEWAKEHPGLAAWRSIGESGLGDQLLAFGAGMLQGHGFADGAGKGFQNVLAVRQAASSGDAQRLEYALKIQKAQQEQGALTANAQLIQRAFPDLSPQQAMGGASNSNLVSAAIVKMQNPNAGRDIKTDAQGVSRYTDTGAKVFADDDGTDDPKEVEIGGNKYWLKPGEKPGDDNLIGPAKDPKEMTANLRDWQALKNAGDPRTFPEYMRDKEPSKGPVVKTFTLNDGTKVDREWDPNTRTWVSPNMGSNAPGERDNSDVPPGVDPATFRKEAAKAAVAEQKANSQRAQQANIAMPILERAEKAYRALADANAIGPYQASRINRAIGGALGANVEVQRQEYEAAAKELELQKAQIQMKGQGSVTENERAILRMTLPRLDAASPETGLTTLRAMREQFTKAAGGGQPRGQAPAQQGGGQPQGGGQQQGAPQQSQTNGAASRYQQLRRGGMSQADAYARMQQEGY